LAVAWEVEGGGRKIARAAARMLITMKKEGPKKLMINGQFRVGVKPAGPGETESGERGEVRWDRRGRYEGGKHPQHPTRAMEMG